jgi:hypothetical protein
MVVFAIDNIRRSAAEESKLKSSLTNSTTSAEISTFMIVIVGYL